MQAASSAGLPLVHRKARALVFPIALLLRALCLAGGVVVMNLLPLGGVPQRRRLNRRTIHVAAPNSLAGKCQPTEQPELPELPTMPP